MVNFKLDDVVQFTENHKWCGCFGYNFATKNPHACMWNESHLYLQ